MTDLDQLNREIADALTAQGFEEGLVGTRWWTCPAGHESQSFIGDGYDLTCAVDGAHGVSCGEPVSDALLPHDFTDPHYLFPALEAWLTTPNTAREWRVIRDELGFWRAGARVEGVDPAGAMDRSRMKAERDAFHSALTRGAQ